MRYGDIATFDYPKGEQSVYSPVRLMRKHSQTLQDLGPRHLGELLFQRVEELGERTFIKAQRGTCFEEISWNEFGDKVGKLMLVLHSLGLSKGERVAILSENRLEWVYADMATLAGGWPNVVISPSLSEPMILKILGHSRARVAFVENEAVARKLLNLKERLPRLLHIIIMEGMDSSLPQTLSFTELLQNGRKIDSESIRELLEGVQPHDLATIMYTSGSTGEPKGVMRTQRNLLSHISGGAEIHLSKPHELFVLALSLNHLLGRLDLHISVATGRTTAIVEETEQELGLKIFQFLAPTCTTLVPRVMEKIWRMILADKESRNQWQAIEALEHAMEAESLLSSDKLRQYEELTVSLRERVKLLLGGSIEYITCGGGPLQARIKHFFKLLGIPLLHSYGATECGRVAISSFDEDRPSSVGRPLPNMEVRIAEDGEILVRGPSVFPGYLEEPAATQEVLDPDGWFHTGDLGAIDLDGFLCVVGRKKDIFNCSDGSNIYPSYIELLLENDPLIHQAVLLGDRRPFIAALIVPDRARIAAGLKTAASALTDSEVHRMLWSRVEPINARLEHHEKIHKIAVLKSDFPKEVRNVTAIQKIKVDRRAVEEKYNREIAEIYSPKPGKRNPLP